MWERILSVWVQTNDQNHSHDTASRVILEIVLSQEMSNSLVKLSWGTVSMGSQGWSNVVVRPKLHVDLGVWLSLGHSLCVLWPPRMQGYISGLVWNLNMAQIRNKMGSNWPWAEGFSTVQGLGIKQAKVYGCTRFVPSLLNGNASLTVLKEVLRWGSLVGEQGVNLNWEPTEGAETAPWESGKELKLGVIEDLVHCPQFVNIAKADFSGYGEQVWYFIVCFWIKIQ